MALLSIRNLTTVFHCREGQIKACQNINLDISPGKTLGLIGETGCGKSVLGMSVLRLLPPNAASSGQILYKGQDLLKLSAKELSKIRGKEIGLLPQSPATSLNPVLKIGAQLTEGLALHQTMSKEKVRSQAVGILKYLGLKDAEQKIEEYPHQLSGGMKQRVLAALSIAGQPSLLIADEPTKGLDAVVRGQVVALLRQLTKRTNTALLLITHDLKTAACLCDEIAVMYAGEIVEKGSAEKILKHPAHPYTQGLLASLPEKGLQPIPGYSPSLLEEICGCKFYARCSQRQDSCRQQPVRGREINGWYVRCLDAAQSEGTQQKIYEREARPTAV